MTQTQAILSDLRKGRRVTPLSALKRYGCLRLAARISDIRRTESVKRELVTRNGKTFAEYSID